MIKNKNKKIKAFLLSAGIGTRLKPLTDITPKCLLPVAGKPLLQYWLEELERAGVEEVLINTHWLHEQVEKFISKWERNKLKITTFYEKELLGSAGTLLANKNWSRDASEILIVYTDNFTNNRIGDILQFHRSHEKSFTLGVFETFEPKRCGIIEVDPNDNVLDFVEKPEHPKSNLAAGGIYVADPSVLENVLKWDFASNEPYDLGKHVLPKIVHQMKAYRLKEKLTDIGTLESYLKVQTATGINNDISSQNPKTFSSGYISRLKKVLEEFPNEQFEKLIELFVYALNNGKTIFVMGNGGSGATASHWVCDINKGCSYEKDKRFRMICLNDNLATVSAYANDVSYEDVFVEQLKNFIQSGDVAIAISGSGNSKNVIKAVEYANSIGAKTIGLLGYSGGNLLNMVQVPIHININDMQIVEDVHMIIVHMCMQRLIPVSK